MINMSDINIRSHFGSSQASNIISIPKSRSYPGVLLRFTLLPLLPQLPRGSLMSISLAQAVRAPSHTRRSHPDEPDDNSSDSADSWLLQDALGAPKDC